LLPAAVAVEIISQVAVKAVLALVVQAVFLLLHRNLLPLHKQLP
jgi:hypothetical protein